jgi:hypothetical protein
MTRQQPVRAASKKSISAGGDAVERYRSALQRIWQYSTGTEESFHQALIKLQGWAEEAVRGDGPLLVPSGVCELIDAVARSLDAVLPALQGAAAADPALADKLGALKSAMLELTQARLVPPQLQVKRDESGKEIIVLEEAPASEQNLAK